MTADHASVLALFCGLPASGKTTLVQQISSLLESREARGVPWYPCVIRYDELVSTDAQAVMAQSKGLTKESRQRLLEASDYYIGWLCGEDCQPSPMCTDPLMEMLVRLKATRRGQKPDGKPLIMVDDNLYYRSMRAAWFKLARKYSLGFCQVFLLCSAEQAIQRNATRLLPVPELTIETMVQKFELARDEPWEQLSVAVDGGPGSMEKVMALLDTASKQPWSPMDIVDSITEPAPPGQIHIWDLELRALVSKLIRQAQEEKSTKSELQAWCLMVQKARQNVLAYLRTLDFCNQKEEVDLERLMQEHLDCSASGAS
uniref:Putative o-phosphoseryl-trnasec kinase n=1 Tax=Rhipicephalus microplus TaxID=6941 RepID=A0A6M2CL44_RHIMP|nr:L-seryl-tRNA(Sec) kinase-like isoform X1 [Rhipicephalus microplus]